MHSLSLNTQDATTQNECSFWKLLRMSLFLLFSWKYDKKDRGQCTCALEDVWASPMFLLAPSFINAFNYKMYVLSYTICVQTQKLLYLLTSCTFSLTLYAHLFALIKELRIIGLKGYKNNSRHDPLATLPTGCICILHILIV